MVSASAVVAPVSAQSHAARHLRVVDAPRFSALPHDVIRDTRVSRDARLLYAVLQMYWWQEGECTASHETMAADMGCSERGLRRYLDELLAAKLIVESAAGVRRSKVYTPAPIGQKEPIEDGSNRTPLSDWNAVNRTKPTVQSDKTDTSNRTVVSDSKKKTPVKKTVEDSTPIGVDAAGAAAKPSAAPARSESAKRATRLPEDADLTDAHVQAAASIGLDRATASAEWPQFKDHHRSRGSTMVDWLAAWRTWCRNSLKFAARKNGAYAAPTRTNQPTTPKPSTNGAKGWSRREY